MHEGFKALVLRLLKVPSEPEAPAGSPGSVKVFRAAPNFYKLKLFLWATHNVIGLTVIVVFLMVFWFGPMGRRVPTGVGLIFEVVELIGFAGFVIQIPFTYMLVRLDYEMRWYIVTDRSLRIRTGIWNVRESTLTFANIQQITVGQGPLQRLLGIYDLEVKTAGGGGGGGGHYGHSARGESMHQGFFHGIDNAPEVRAMMLERLRHLRDTGLGDLDEAHHEQAGAPQTSTALLDAARELLQETQALRQAAG